MAVFTISSADEVLKYNKGDGLYVWSKEGLNLRKSPGVKGKRIMTIPYGGKVIVQNDRSSHLGFMYANMSGYWVNVRYKKSTGYIFDGLLSPFRIPKPEGYQSGKLGYFDEQFGTPSVRTTKRGGETLNIREYKNGVMIKETLKAMYEKMEYSFPRIRLYTAFWLFKHLKNISYFSIVKHYPAKSEKLYGLGFPSGYPAMNITVTRKGNTIRSIRFLASGASCQELLEKRGTSTVFTRVCEE